MNETITNPKKELYKKILAVQKVLEPLEKTGWNDFQKYNYSTAGDVLLPVQRACNEQGLIVIADCIESKIEPGRASVVVRLSVVDTETGESLSVTAPGMEIRQFIKRLLVRLSTLFVLAFAYHQTTIRNIRLKS